MSSFFGRVWRITIFRSNGAVLDPRAFDEATGIEITDLDFKADIEKKLEKNPNTCELTIYNLAERERALVKELPITVRFEAGYDGILELLYLGDVRFASSDLKDDTWETRIHLKDGGRAYAGAFTTASYKKGTPVGTIVRDVARTMGLILPPNLDGVADMNAGIPRGLSLDGYSEDHLTELLAPYGFGWSTQNGVLQVIRSDQFRDEEAFVVSEDDAAMISSPQYSVPHKEGKPPKLEFKTLLWPALQPGAKVDLRARSARGVHKVLSLKHKLDTDSDEWITQVEAKQV